MITLRLPDTAYELVKRYAEADQQSMNAWIENLLDVESLSDVNNTLFKILATPGR